MCRKGIFSYDKVQDRGESFCCPSPLTCGYQHFRGCSLLIPVHPQAQFLHQPTATSPSEATAGPGSSFPQPCPTAGPWHGIGPYPTSGRCSVPPAPHSWWNEGAGQAAHPIPSSSRSKMVFSLSLSSGKRLQLSPQSNSCGGQYFESGPENVQEMAVSDSGGKAAQLIPVFCNSL